MSCTCIISQREREREREMGREALVVCSDKRMGIGITIWDMDTREQLLHIPTCASPPNGLLCLRNQFLVASQIHKHGSLGGGTIFTWALNKPHQPLRSYPLEAIGPVCCTTNGVYLAGGALSGNAYLWEVANGRLLKTWPAHHKSLSSMAFSGDNCFLIIGSDDGTIHVWSMIGLLDVADCGSMPSLFHCSSEHVSPITGLRCTFGSSNSVFVSSSLDGTCKVWDLVTGRLLQTRVFPQAITAIALDPGAQLLFSGSADGRIFVNRLDIGLMENPFVVSEDQLIVLNGHKGSITALAFCRSGLISASEDSTACLWNVVSWVTMRKFYHQKGAISNVVIIPQSSLLPLLKHQRISNQNHISSLEKYPQPVDSSKGITTLVSLRDHQTTSDFQRTDSLNQQILELEQGWTPAAVQMKVETSVENRMWATRMVKHVMEMNKHLQSRLLDLIQCRLLQPPERDSPTMEKRKRPKVESPPLQGEDQLQSPV